MDETARVVLVAATLSAAAVTMLAWRITRFDPATPERLVGELSLARWAAVLLAGVGAMTIGLAVARPDIPAANVDAALGMVFVGLAGIVLQREPREGLLLAAIAFSAHALMNLAHRPGWLPPDLAPPWFLIGCATYDVYVAGLCFWTRRR